MDQRLSVSLLLLGLTVLVDGQTVAAPFTGNITRNGCGATRFCIETPTGCDPASGGNCLFASTASDTTSTTGISFNLQGNSSGYIAAILTTAGNNSTRDAFVCAQNASDTLFYRAVYSSNGSSLSPEILNNTVGNITGTTTNNVIKCAFIVRDLSITRDRAIAQYSISLAVGSLVNGQLGTATLRVQSNGTVNLLSTSSTNTTAPSGGNRPAFVAMHGELRVIPAVQGVGAPAPLAGLCTSRCGSCDGPVAVQSCCAGRFRGFRGNRLETPIRQANGNWNEVQGLLVLVAGLLVGVQF